LDMEAVLRGGPWTFDNHLLIVERVQVGVQIENIPLNHADFWVQIHGLPTGLMKEKVGSSLGNYLGSLLEYDRNNNSSFWRQYMRLRVRIDVRLPLKKDSRVKDRNGEWCMVKFKYEKLGIFCFVCGIMGHTESKCEIRFAMNNDDGRREWSNELRAEPKRAAGRPVSRWLVEEHGGGPSRPGGGGPIPRGGGENSGTRQRNGDNSKSAPSNLVFNAPASHNGKNPISHDHLNMDTSAAYSLTNYYQPSNQPFLPNNLVNSPIIISGPTILKKSAPTIHTLTHQPVDPNVDPKILTIPKQTNTQIHPNQSNPTGPIAHLVTIEDDTENIVEMDIQPGLPGPMIILSWNCRGLSTPNAIPNLRRLAQKHRPDVLFLSETLSKSHQLERIRVLLKYESCLSIDVEGRSGGLAILWNDKLKCKIVNYSRNFINVEVEEAEKGVWRLTCYYGFPERGRRREAWDMLRDLRNMSSLPWCIIGDFNDLLSQEDKVGNHPHPNWLCTGFRNAVSDCDLTDIQLEGHRFTWIKSRGTPHVIEERLDRAMASSDWLALFPEVKLTNLVASHSDHSPILLQTDPVRRN
ncbi:endonuclease/exonuclease/phosphatase family protein, partial [Trifolium pratense]